MILSTLQGVIFDNDDTLLDTKVYRPEGGIHEEARLAAIKQIGRDRNLPQLINYSAAENIQAFRKASEHTVAGSIQYVLWSTGLAESNKVDQSNLLLLEIMALKNKLFEDLLRVHAECFIGADRCVRLLHQKMSGKLAMASMGMRRDINIFLKAVDLKQYFPDHRIISIEDVIYPKPHPQVWELAYASLDLPTSAKKQVLAIGDDPRDVVSAQAAGLSTCAITTRFSRLDWSEQTITPDLIVDSYAELEQLLLTNQPF